MIRIGFAIAVNLFWFSMSFFSSLRADVKWYSKKKVSSQILSKSIQVDATEQRKGHSCSSTFELLLDTLSWFYKVAKYVALPKVLFSALGYHLLDF